MSENRVNSSSDPVGSETPQTKLLPPSKTYTFHFPYKQHFPFPFDVIKYIIKNPKSSYVLLKLYKTCKHFYSKKQVLIIFGKITFFPNDGFCDFQAENKKDFTDIKKDIQIWFENDLFIDNKSLYYFTKLYRCTVKFLAINGNLTFKEFQILVAEETVEDFKFGRFANFSKSNGKEANIVEIYQLLTNVRIFWYYNGREKYSEKILKEMNSFNSQNTKLLEFLLMLNEVPENFDSNLLFHFIQKNSAPFCQIYLIPFGENKDAALLKLKGAEEKFKCLKEWKDKNFVLNFDNPK